MRLSDRVAHFIVHRSGLLWLLFALLVSTAVMLIWLRAKLNSDVLDLLPGQFESVQIYKLADREFSSARELLFGIAAPNDPNDEIEVEEFTKHFAGMLRKEKWVVRVMEQSPLEAPGGLEELRSVALPLMLNQSDADFENLKAALAPEAITERLAVLRAKFQSGIGKSQFEMYHDPLGIVFPALKSLRLSKGDMGDDPKFRVVFAHCDQPDLNEPACNEIMNKVEDFKKRVLAAWKGPAPEILCTGRTVYVSEMAGKLKSDIISTLGGSIALVGLTFWAGFRRWKPLRAIVDALLLSCLLAVACGAAFFGSLNMITIGLCAILVGLGVDLAMVLYALYLNECEHGRSHEQAIAASLHTHARGIWFGALTTAAAFLCLLGSGSPGFQQLGVLIACGILLAALVIMVFLWLLFDMPRWFYVALALGSWGYFDWSSGNWQAHVWLNAGMAVVAVVLALLPGKIFKVITLSACTIAGVAYVATTITHWNSYVWQNVLSGLGAAVIAVLLVYLLGMITARVPAIVLSQPKKILVPGTLFLVALAALAIIPFRPVLFDLDPKTLEPKDSNAGYALREIMKHLNKDGIDSVMAIIEAPDQESLASAWEKAHEAWEKLIPDILTEMSTPAGLATSPARMTEHAKSLASIDFAKSKAAFDAALQGSSPGEFDGARGLLDALSEAASGKLNVVEWRHNLSQSSAWWFLIDGFLSHERPLGRARLKPTKEIKGPEDAAALRRALAVPGVHVGFSGWGFTLAELEPFSRSKMVQLSVYMVAINLVILGVLFRSWKEVAVVMIGMGFSICGLFATMKITGVSLNLFNVIAFPLVLGVGVDYSIYAAVAALSADPRKELNALMKPLLLSGLTTVIGFITLVWSYNPALGGLGMLCGIGVGWCMITTFLFVLPATAIIARQRQLPGHSPEELMAKR